AGTSTQTLSTTCMPSSSTQCACAASAPPIPRSGSTSRSVSPPSSEIACMRLGCAFWICMALHTQVESPPRSAMTPVSYRVVGRRVESADVVTLQLEATDGSRLRFAAGQFNMLYAYAVGEVAISISANPLGDGPIAHTVRNVGSVSPAL